MGGIKRKIYVFLKRTLIFIPTFLSRKMYTVCPFKNYTSYSGANNLI
jgi:hypothetical protein